jgi:group II intron reverse transcriptase/maturase
MTKASDFEIVSTRQQRIATLAKQSQQMGFTSLNQYLDLAWVREAFRRTRKDGATGVDGQTAADYEANLEANLESLLERVKSGTYRAPAVRRVQIPKGNGKDRPIGIPAFEDKVLQRAIAMLLEPIYEQDFESCSYGFRPRLSAHDALEDIRATATDWGGGWIIDADIQQFFDRLDRSHLRTFVGQRIHDGVVKRLIGKWLNAGVMEDGRVWYPEEGTPQGGVISPLLANVFLHEVLDRWFVETVCPRLSGRARLVRYADDFIIVLSDRRDADRVLEVLPKRLARFGLSLHPDKTRLVPFRRPRRDTPPPCVDGGNDHPETFDFLGFTHYWGRSRRGKWVVMKKTMKSRLQRTLRKVNAWCRANRHLPIPEQHTHLCRLFRGHCNYYGVTGNLPTLSMLHRQMVRLWHKWLNRRSRERTLYWERFRQSILARHPLPAPCLPRSIYRR